MWWFAKRVTDKSRRLARLVRCPRCRLRYSRDHERCPYCSELGDRELAQQLSARRGFRVSLGKAMIVAAMLLLALMAVGAWLAR